MLSVAPGHTGSMENKTTRAHRLVWAEIPATDLDRAISTYSQLLDTPIERRSTGPLEMGVFSYQPGSTSAAVIRSPLHQPGEQGPLVYLNAEPSLNRVLERASALGLAILTPATALPPPMGYFAIIRDSEGNRVGLHAPNL